MAAKVLKKEHAVMSQKDVDGMANSVVLDKVVPLAV